ncbi:DUF5713 family protein [Kitasatospora sp. NPDC048722]|uniref:DUF5713 family protein n=1 Tax=Kitasatospora sp. NPDC048722 TaxID=3155639 RepID=UPI0033FA4836
MPITNDKVLQYSFLRGMYRDDYYPDAVVDQGCAILRRLCERIEAERPGGLDALYALTAVATEEFNVLQEAFEAADSEIETIGRELIAEDFWFIANAYGFADADAEALIAERDW